VRTGQLIERYKQATCVPWTFHPAIRPDTRSWDYNFRTRQGVTAHISGAQLPGGRIDVTFEPGGQKTVAANAGDYIWPADVRIEPARDLLYVKASGSAGGWRPEIWLIEYDLQHRRETSRLLVDGSALPEECAASR